MPYARHGADFRAGQGGINRPAFTSALVEEWLPALGSAADRLADGGRIADLARQGWSTLAVARAYPKAVVWSVDIDKASIADARTAAQEQNLTVRFECTDAAGLAANGPVDVLRR